MSSERDQDMLRRYKAGATMASIAKQYGITLSAVSKALKRQGLIVTKEDRIQRHARKGARPRLYTFSPELRSLYVNARTIMPASEVHPMMDREIERMIQRTKG